MGIGSSGVSGTPPSGGDMERLVEMMRFFGDKEAVAARMAEFTAREAEIDERLAVLGGAERAKDLIAEAEKASKRSEDFRVNTLNATMIETERLKKNAHTELAEAEATRKRARVEFQSREEKVEADERDLSKRKKAIEQGEALLKSGQEKLRAAEREADEKQNLYQAKLAAIRKIAEGQP